MAIRLLANELHGILSAGLISTGNSANVDRLFLARLEINPIPTGVSRTRRLFASDDNAASTIRWLTFPTAGTDPAPLRIAVNREVGDAYRADWLISPDNWTTTLPRCTLVLRLGGTPGGGRTALFKDGEKLTISSEVNASGEFATQNQIDQGCIGSTGRLADGFGLERTLPCSMDLFKAWRVSDGAFTGSFLVSDEVCEALSAGVSPQSMGLPLADIGYEFRQDGSIVRTGRLTNNRTDSAGFEEGGGTYTVFPQALIAEPVEVAATGLTATLSTLGATASATVQCSIDTLGATLEADGATAQDALIAAIDALGAALDTDGAAAIAAIDAEVLGGALTATLSTLAATASMTGVATITPLGATLATDADDATATLAAQVLALGATLEALGADAVAAFEGEVIDVTPQAILNTLGATAVASIAAAVQPLAATLDTLGAEATDAVLMSLPFVPGSSGLNLAALRKRALAYRDLIAPSNTIRVRRDAAVFRNYDGTFPRVQRLSDSQRLLVPGVSETSTVFRVRLIVADAPATVGAYELSFDGGISWQGVRLMGSAYRDAGNNAWVFNVERGV